MISAEAFVDPNAIKQFTNCKTIEILPAGNVLYAEMKLVYGEKAPDGFFNSRAPIVLKAPLRMTLRGTKKPILEDCSCELPTLNKTAHSINEAYTRLSERYEPNRRSHTGNVFQKVFYRPDGKGHLYSLEELRLSVEMADEKNLLTAPTT